MTKRNKDNKKVGGSDVHHDAFLILNAMGESTDKLWFSADPACCFEFPARFFTSKKAAQTHADYYNAACVNAGGNHPGFRALSFKEVETEMKNRHRDEGAKEEYYSRNGYP